MREHNLRFGIHERIEHKVRSNITFDSIFDSHIQYFSRNCKLLNREICYSKVGSNEIDASSPCKIPVHYNHSFIPYEYHEISPNGTLLGIYKFNTNHQFEAEIKFFEARPAHGQTKTVKLAMQNDFKYTHFYSTLNSHKTSR